MLHFIDIFFSYETESMRKLLQATAVRAGITSCSFIDFFNCTLAFYTFFFSLEMMEIIAQLLDQLLFLSV